MRVGWLWAGLLLFIVPVSANNSHEDVFGAGFASVTASSTQEESGAGASALRGQADADHDGTVTPAEVSALKDKMRQGLQAALSRAPTLDGKAPVGAEDLELDVLGAEGPAASQANVTLHYVLRVDYEPGPGPQHTYTVKFWSANDPSRTTASEGSIRAPPGYVIGSATGLPGEATVDGDTVTFTDDNSYDGTGTVVFKPESAAVTSRTTTKASPAPWMGSGLAIVGLAALHRRK